jgi:pimeloyl-ACP methyl ester carboxylesterase
MLSSKSIAVLAALALVPALIGGIYFITGARHGVKKDNTPGGMTARGQGPAWVVLVHGMLSSPTAMTRIEKELSQNGYRVLNFGYDSRKSSIEDVTVDLERAIREQVPADAGTVHFVTHSLGGLVVRYYLSERTMKNLGRFVMIAPPNQGSIWGKTLVKNIPAVRYLLGITGEELQYSLKYRPAQPPPCEFGVISGGTGTSRGLNPLIPGDNDATVAVEETKLDGMKDHIVIPGQHTMLLFQKRVIDNVISFLGTGRFIY